MKTILFATDLKVNSDRAMGRAIKLAKAQKATLHVFHALHAYKAKDFRQSLVEQTHSIIEGYLSEYMDAEGLKVEIKIAYNDHAHELILQYAYDIKADLIVMGMHGKEKFRDFFVGTTIERVARQARKPILMVRNKALEPYQHLLAAVDFAPASRAALRTAISLSPKANLQMLHAYEIPFIYPSMPEHALNMIDISKKSQERMMERFFKTEVSHYKAEYEEAVAKYNSKTFEGNAFKTLTSEAKAMKADLIAIGAHGKSTLAPSKLGGLAEDILANPPCDVLLVKE